MKILWFSVTPSMFNPRSNSHNGGGWIAALEQLVRQEPSIELGVAFQYPNADFKYERDSVNYYPIPVRRKSIFQRLQGKDGKIEMINHCLRIIDDFQPDLIQIFGSENDFGLLCLQTDIPIVIHMQGCLPPYYNALFPVGMNKYDFFFCKGLTWHFRWMGLRSELSFRKRAEQEIQTIQHCRYFMGRTDWDKRMVNLFNPKAVYFHCEEALRNSFLTGNKHWMPISSTKINIVSVISSPWYKGADLILKTAKLLKRFTSLDFEWRIYGVRDIRFYEQKYGIRASEVNVCPMGTASKEKLVDVLCASSLYVHPSYIDNSPNSVCEAQILGMPVLATNIGGLSTIVRDGETGILFPANDPYTLASHIKQLASDTCRCQSLGEAAMRQATERHNPSKIRKTLLRVYQTILQDEKVYH